MDRKEGFFKKKKSKPRDCEQNFPGRNNAHAEG